LALVTRGIFLYEQEANDRLNKTKRVAKKWINIFKNPNPILTDPHYTPENRICLMIKEGQFSAINFVNSNLIYAGTSKGAVFLLKKINNDWTVTDISPNLKDNNQIKYWPTSDNPMPINDIATFPENDHEIAIVFGGISEEKIAMIWRCQISENGVTTWNHISGYSVNHSDPPTLSSIPVNSIVIEPNNPKSMYIGTDIGVFRTENEGKSWNKFGNRLPNCSVLDLRLLLYKNGQTPFRLLRAATHGRGLWELEMDKRTNKCDVDLYVRSYYGYWTVHSFVIWKPKVSVSRSSKGY
jgi:hypothetical protein